MLKCFLLDLGVLFASLRLYKELLKANCNPGDLFLMLFALGDNVIGWVELKYRFGFEFGF